MLAQFHGLALLNGSCIFTWEDALVTRIADIFDPKQNERPQDVLKSILLFGNLYKELCDD
jgi:hypothetical protein